MKTFRTIGLALAAVFMCVNFTACEEDDEEPAAEGKAKKLVEMNITLDYVSDDLEPRSETHLFKLKYDDKGRLAYCEESYKNYYRTETATHTFKWDGDVISCESNGNYSYYDYTHNLENGFVKSFSRGYYSPDGSDGPIKYQGATDFQLEMKDNKLAKYIYDDGEDSRTITFGWDNDKLSNLNNYACFTYSGETCKGYIPFIFEDLELENNPLYLSNPELFGFKITSLPSKLENGDDDAAYYSSYKFDKDGYVESYKVLVSYGDEEEDKCDYTISLKWE